MFLYEIECFLGVNDYFSARLSNGIFDHATVLDTVRGSLAALEKFAETFDSVNEPTLCSRGNIFVRGNAFGSGRGLDKMRVK